jgi:hypothetical protein
MDAAQTPIHPIDPPPAIYQRAYRGALSIRQGTLAQVEHYCHTMQGIVSQYRALGCSKVDEGSCFVMIPKIGGPVTASIQAQIRRHELAHCNGWPATTRVRVAHQVPPLLACLLVSSTSGRPRQKPVSPAGSPSPQ